MVAKMFLLPKGKVILRGKIIKMKNEVVMDLSSWDCFIVVEKQDGKGRNRQDH